MGLPAAKFDTLSFAKALKDAGVNEKQAEVYAEKQAEIIQMLQDEQLVTKDDIHRLELEIVKAQQGISLLDEKVQHQGKEFESALKLVVVDLKHELKSLSKGLTIRLTVILGSLLGLLMTFFEFMHKFKFL